MLPCPRPARVAGVAGGQATSSVEDEQQQQPGDALPVDVAAWITEVAGGPIVAAVPKSGGLSRQSFVIDLGSPARMSKAFCRRTRPGSPLSGSFYDLAHEAAIYRALAGGDVPLAALYGESPDGSTLLLEHVEGAGDFTGAAGTPEGEAAAGAFMGTLAAIHRLPLPGLGLPVDAVVDSVGEAVAREIDIWDGVRAAHCRRVDPTLSYVATWLRANIPAAEQHPVLLHGDPGPGNFLFEGGRMLAVVDWELWHLGDPMEDLAWLAIRSMLQPFGDLRRRWAEYRAAGGTTPAAGRGEYYRVLCAWRNCVSLGAQLDAPADDTDLASCLAYENTFARLALAIIRQAAGYPDLRGARPAAEDPEDISIHGALAAQLAAFLDSPAAANAGGRRRLRGWLRVLRYLERRDRLGPVLDEADRRELAALAGGDGAEGALRSLDGIAREPAVLGRHDVHAYLEQRAARQAHLLQPVLGRLAADAPPVPW